MDILDVNKYLNAASDALQNELEYLHWAQALIDARKEAMEKCDYSTDKVEGCLWQLYARQVAYILENKDRIDKKIRADAEAAALLSDFEEGRSFSAREVLDELRNRHNDDMRDEYDIDSLNPRPNPYADELNKEFDFSNAVKNPYAKMYFEGINNISDDFMADTDSRTEPKAIDEMSKTEYDAMMAKGLAQAKADEGKPASDVLKDVRATIEDALDEADAYSEKHHKRLTHEQIFNSETKVTFRQVVEKTITVDGRNMSDIQAQIEKLKENPDEIDFDKDCDSVVIEARVNL